jgi:uncharacterized membrane protein required for colicin V production
VTLDAVVLCALALAAAAGALAGALRQVFLAAGAAAGWAAMRLFAPSAGRLLERALPPALARAVAGAALFLLVFAVVTLLGRVLRRRSAGAGRPVDRALGALLGGAEAALAAGVALAVLDAAAPLLPRGLEQQVARSDLAALVRERDLLGPWRRPAEQALGTLLQLAGDPRSAARLAVDPQLQGLVSDPRVQELVERARAGQAASAQPLRTPEALQLLADPDFRERLERAQERIDRERQRR